MGRSFLWVLLCSLLVIAQVGTFVSGQSTKGTAPAGVGPGKDEDSLGAEALLGGASRSATKSKAADAVLDGTDSAAGKAPQSGIKGGEVSDEIEPAAGKASRSKAKANVVPDETDSAQKRSPRSRSKVTVSTDDAESTATSEGTRSSKTQAGTNSSADKAGSVASSTVSDTVRAVKDTVSDSVTAVKDTVSDSVTALKDSATSAAAKITSREKSESDSVPQSPKATSSRTTQKPAAEGTDDQASVVDDIKQDGNCSAEIAAHCKGKAPGSASLVNCITERVKVDKSGNDDAGPAISDKCKAEVRAFKIKMYSDVSMDKKMEKACLKEIRNYCDDDFLYPEPGNIVACLREVNQAEHLTPSCKAEVFRAQLDAAKDFTMDPQLNELCGTEAAKYCKDLKPGEGAIQDCLRANRKNLAWDCQAELFRQEVENANDIRLNVRLFQACLLEKRRFCKDVAPGDARVKDCLEAHRLDPDFGPGCKTEFDKVIVRRATDFRLDPSLRKYCKNDITDICYPDAEDITDVANYDAKVIQCLQDYRDELKDPMCRQQVHQLTKRAAEDIRFDRPLADVCAGDRAEMCKGVPNGNAQVFLCLQSNRDKLHGPCRAALFEQEVRFAEDIDFKFPMKQACTAELTKFCSDITHGHAAVIKCLQEKIADPDMGEDCKKEVKRDEIRSAADYRLNYRLNRACMNDIQKSCWDACSDDTSAVPCGGKVLKCLTDNMAKIESKTCKAEVFSFEKREAEDISLDVPLQAACASDLKKLCPDISKDHATTLSCLRTHKEKLTPECKAEENRFSVMEASDIRLTPTLMNGCGLELHQFCKDVPPSGGQMFKCLQENLEEVGMSTACKGEVNLQEARHSRDYRLDAAVKKACEADAGMLCADVDPATKGHAGFLRCFVDKYSELGGGCQTELQYAVRAALWQYMRGNDLTADCDASVDELCKSEDAKPIQGAVIGKYGQCLLSPTAEPKLTPFCKKLVKVAGKEGGHVGGKIDDQRLADTLAKLEALQQGAYAHPSGQGLVLTGWVAFAAMGSLIAVLFGAGYAGYRKYYGKHNQYTLVVKGGDV